MESEVNSSTSQGFVGKQFDQVAFVVDELESAQKRFGRLYGIETWNVWTNLADGQSNKIYRGHPGTYQFSCASAFVGDLMVELCQHDGGRSVYKDLLDSRGPGLNPLGFRLDNRDVVAGAGAEFERDGPPAPKGGEIAR